VGVHRESTQPIESIVIGVVLHVKMSLKIFLLLIRLFKMHLSNKTLVCMKFDHQKISKTFVIFNGNITILMLLIPHSNGFQNVNNTKLHNEYVGGMHCNKHIEFWAIIHLTHVEF
jgi:hypothetical protein